MRLGQRLQIYLIMFGAIAIGLVASQYWLNRQFVQFTDKIDTIAEISHNISHISYLTTEVIEFPDEKRPRAQWLEVYTRLSVLMKNPLLSEHGQHGELEAMISALESMSLNYNRMLEMQYLGSDVTISPESRRRVWAATNIASQSVVDQASKMRIELVDAQLRLYNQTLILFVLVVSLTLGFSLLFFRYSNRQIINAIALLRQGISRLAEGRLETRVKLIADEELQHIATALNEMAEMLQQTTATKDELEAVVKERTAMLEKSRLAAISIMEDLNLQRKRIEQAREEAVAANRAKSTFLANMSHELRTPLNAILGFSQLMQDSAEFTGKARSNLEIINRSGEHLLQLINDVLDMSKIEAGHVKLEKDDFDLGGLINDVVDMMRVRAEDKDLIIKVDQNSEFPRFVCGDAPKIRQILINLVSNAIKFTDKGSIEIRFNGHKLDEEQFELICEVEDSGSGIPADKIESIFRPFEQVVESQSDRTRQQGTGLGLTLVKQFVEMMDGRIEVESEPGEGSIFRFVIHVGKASREIPVEPVEGNRRVIGLQAGQHEFRILIAEDQAANAALLQQILEQVGFRVKVATDGEEAVTIFKEWQPHFIWMDRRMPVMDGVEATQKIRGLSGGDNVKISALTASVLRREQDELEQYGFDDFVRKPFRAEEIFSCLAKHLHVKYLYDEPEEATAAANDRKEALHKLSELPDETRKSLLEAVTLLDINRTNALITEIREMDAEAADLLAIYADAFDFTSMKKILENGNGTG